MKNERKKITEKIITWLRKNPKKNIKIVLQILAILIFSIGFLFGSCIGYFCRPRSTAFINASAESISDIDNSDHSFTTVTLGNRTETVALFPAINFYGSATQSFSLYIGLTVNQGANGLSYGQNIYMCYFSNGQKTGERFISVLSGAQTIYFVGYNPPGGFVANAVGSYDGISPAALTDSVISLSMFFESMSQSRFVINYQVGENSFIRLNFAFNDSAVLVGSIECRGVVIRATSGATPVPVNTFSFLSTRTAQPVIAGYTKSEFDEYGTLRYNAGVTNGYARGLNDGLSHAENGDFMTLISSVIDAPVSILSSLFDVEILGFNMKQVLLSILSITFVVLIVKTFTRFGG